MLHDPSHTAPVSTAAEIVVTQKDKDVLKKLGTEIAEIASLPVHKVKAALWRKLNDLESTRPMVWINEIPWHEMNVDDALTLQCQHPWAKALEENLRKTIYQWKHMPGDMVVNDYLDCPLIIHSSNFGIIEDVDILKTDENNGVYSRHFKVQIKEPEDIEKIKMPEIFHNEKATESNYQAMTDIFGSIIPVKKVGQSHIWFTPWDFLIRWWGIQEAMMDLVTRPDMVHAAYERMVDAWIVELDQFEAQNLLSLDANNTRIGSGGYGYVSDLPGEHFDPHHVKPKQMWGCSNAQIFSSVSPQMHWDFALEHDQRWLDRWGLTYYGCCEPLDRKMELLRKIPNLRKISVSPWCNSEKIIHEIGTDYVMSTKPSPSIFVGNEWSPEKAEAELRDFLEKTEGQCHVELIMKDISTVQYKPQTLWDWEKIAMKIADEYAR